MLDHQKTTRERFVELREKFAEPMMKDQIAAIASDTLEWMLANRERYGVDGELIDEGFMPPENDDQDPFNQHHNRQVRFQLAYANGLNHLIAEAYGQKLFDLQDAAVSLKMVFEYPSIALLLELEKRSRTERLATKVSLQDATKRFYSSPSARDRLRDGRLIFWAEHGLVSVSTPADGSFAIMTGPLHRLFVDRALIPYLSEKEL